MTASRVAEFSGGGERWCRLPIGWCHLRASSAGLTGLRLVAEGSGPLAKGAERGNDAGAEAVLDLAERELRAYFAGTLREFTVPVDLAGVTAFRAAVLKACRDIPYGRTLSYGQLPWGRRWRTTRWRWSSPATGWWGMTAA